MKSSKTLLLRPSLLATACLAAFTAFIPQAEAAPLTLSGATAFNASANGTYNSGAGGFTSTSCCQTITAESATFGSGVVSLPFTLSLGTNVLYLRSEDWTSVYSVSTGGINLFFDGSSTAGISAHTTPIGDKTAAGAFLVTGSGLDTASLTNTIIPSSGSLSFDDGSRTVTLTGLQWVKGDGSNPYSAAFTVQKVTLSVTADTVSGTPEPATWTAMAAGLAFLAVRRRVRG